MNRNFCFKLVSIAIVLGLLLGACSAPPNEAPIEEPAEEPAELPPELDATNLGESLAPGRIVLAQDLLMLTPDMLADIEPVTEESNTITAEQLELAGGVITFSNNNLNAAALTQNEIIWSGVTDEMPYGLLLKVVEDARTDNTGKVIVPTEQATLEDAIEDGSISTNTENMILAFTETESYSKGSGHMKVTPKPMSGEIYIDLKEAVLLDQGENKKLIADGTIIITPSFDLNIEIRKFSVQEFMFRNKTSVNADVKIKSDIDIIGINPRILIYKYPYKPITKMVGSLPVVITPILNVYVGFDGNVSAGFSTGVNYKNDLDRGIHYVNGNWKSLEPTNNPSFTPIWPTLNVTTSAKVYVQSKLEFLIYGVIGPYGEIYGNIQLTASPQKTIWWTMGAVITAEVGVEFKMFKFLKKFTFRQPFILYQDVIAQATSEPPSVAAQPEETEPPAPESPPEPPAPDEPVVPSGGDDNPPEGGEAPPEPPPPAPTGNENIRVVYNNTSAFVMTITQAPVRLKGLVFNRIDNQGTVTASYQVNTWGSFYSGYDPIQPGYCPRIALPNSPTAPDCNVSVNYETSQDGYHFWRETSTSKQFQVLQNGAVLQTCEISAGSCDVYVPQP